MRKVRRYTEWQSMPYKEKSQYDEFQRISTMAHNAGIPKIIIDEALRYHKKISEQKNDARRLETPRLRDPDVARDREPTRVRQRRHRRPPALSVEHDVRRGPLRAQGI